MIFRVFLLKTKIPRLHSKGEVRGTTLFITCFIGNGMNRPELNHPVKAAEPLPAFSSHFHPNNSKATFDPPCAGQPFSR